MRGGQGRTVALSAMVGAVVATATTAFAATGGNFILGQPNAASSTTSLDATTSGRALQVTNSGGGQGIGITVPSGKAPLVVNTSAGKATNLSADKLDGFDGGAFVRRSVQATGSPAGAVVDARNDGTGAGVRGASSNAGGTGVRAVNTAGGYAGVFDGTVRIDGALECPGCTVPNADTLSGRTVAELRPKLLLSDQRLTDNCDTPNTWMPCGSIPLTVPAGKTYQVLVLARASMYEASATNRVLWCASIRSASTSVPNCFGEEAGLILGPQEMQMSTAVTAKTLGPGEYVLGGAINTTNPLDFDSAFDFGHAQTSALVVDVT